MAVIQPLIVPLIEPADSAADQIWRCSRIWQMLYRSTSYRHSCRVALIAQALARIANQAMSWPLDLEWVGMLGLVHDHLEN